jgi:flagellar hook-associated protein 2
LALGVGSSLDVNSLVTQLMQAEQQPLTVLDTKEAKYQAQLSAYGSLKGALSTFQTTVATLANKAKFSAVTASLADTTVASASASSTATAGNYSVKVTALAQSQKLQSDSAFTTTSDLLGSGTLTISFGTYNPGFTSFTLNPDKASKTITIGAGQSSLSGVRDAINAANIGVSANIINDGTTGNHLVITSNDTGAANALRITVTNYSVGSNADNFGLSQLAFDPAAVIPVQHMTQPAASAAQNATLTIDGIAISKASNTVTDAIQGVTLNLLNVNATATTLTVARDTTAAQTAVQSFVTAYNKVNKIITDLSNYDLVNKKAAILTGDPAMTSLKSQLRAVFNTALSTAGGGLTALPDIGVTFQRDGTLALDSTKLNTVLSNPTKDVSTLFAAIGKPSDSLVTFGTSTTATKNGIYALNVSQLATQGKAVGTAPTFPLVITLSTNDTLSLTIDGKAASVTLAAGSYATAAALAAEIQSKVNGASALSSAGISVAVTEAAGVLTITSNRYGSGSTVTTIAGTAAGATFGTINYTNGTGLDAAGTIGGVAATGNGQTLTGAGNASGLALVVAGGATGARGSMNFARGYAYELNNLTGKMLDTKNLVDNRVTGINASIKDIGTRRDELNLRLAAIEKRYRAQFVALDGMLSGMNQTSNFLTQQLANLPGAGK